MTSFDDTSVKTNILYHLTKSSNAQSIAVTGIRSWNHLGDERRNGFTNSWTITDEPWRKDTIWLTHDPDSVVHQMASEFWENDGVVIEVDVTDIDTRLREVYYNEMNEPIEYIVNSFIPVDRIKKITPYKEWKT